MLCNTGKQQKEQCKQQAGYKINPNMRNLGGDPDI